MNRLNQRFYTLNFRFNFRKIFIFSAWAGDDFVHKYYLSKAFIFSILLKCRSFVGSGDSSQSVTALKTSSSLTNLIPIERAFDPLCSRVSFKISKGSELASPSALTAWVGMAGV